MITQESLKEVLHYSPETGLFVWKVALNGRRKAGEIAGTKTKVYVEIMLGRKIYKAHRLAWFYVYGRWPLNEIDHINRNPRDNRLCNLREATSQQNSFNTKKKRSLTGVPGVYPSGRKFRAKMTHNGKAIYLGSFETVWEASAAYQAAALERGGEFAARA